ncbi:hypothetical protein ACWD7F_20360 [Streptomyces sp. NPDC005122]
MTPPPRGSGAAARLTASGLTASGLTVAGPTASGLTVAGPTAVRTDRDDFGGERFDGNRRAVNHRAAHRFDDSEGGR